MRKTIPILMAIALSVTLTSPALAAQSPGTNPRKMVEAKPLTVKQVKQIIKQIQSDPNLIELLRGPQGEQGEQGLPGESVTGPQGPVGPSGPSGGSGPAGPQGPAGTAGSDGQDGRDGVGLASGMIFLVNGACPPGATVQGAQNRWTVYANDTSGRPWTTTGSSAQLFLSACLVN